jgi:putative ABC transport system permease protein
MRNDRHPPKIAEWIVRLLARSGNRHSLLGDLEEEYRYVYAEDGRFRAGLWYLGQVIIPVFNFIRSRILWSFVMFENYLKIACRNIRKQKGCSFINISGLGVGMACFILIYMYVTHEFSYDKFYKDAEYIYRVETRVNFGSQELSFSTSCDPLISILREKYPEVESAVRISSRRVLVDHNNTKFYESGFIYAEKDIFDIFNMKFLQGNPEMSFVRLNSMIISKDMAEKYFGNDNPIGKSLKINGNDYEITAIVQNPPTNTHLRYSFITSMNNSKRADEMTNWANVSTLGYIKLTPDVIVKEFEEEIKYIAHEYRGEYFKEQGWTYICSLQPLVAIHLRSVNKPFLYILSTIAIFVLILACLNFISLSTARASNRLKEVGLRKTVGAHRTQLVTQFIGESLLISIIAFIFSSLLVMIAIPFFNNLTGRELKSIKLLQLNHIGLIIFLILFVGIASGVYPAFFLSRLKPILAVNNQIFKGKRKSLLRNTFIICQFTVSVILMICTTAIYSQIDFMKSRYLGFEKGQKVIFNANFKNNHEAIKNEFLKHHDVDGATACYAPPGRGYNNRTTRVVGKEEENWAMNWISFDHDFIPEYKIQIAAGRPFSENMRTDAAESCIINEAAVKIFGWDSPEEAIGKILERGPRKPENRNTIIGVVKNFHYTGLQDAVEPLVMLNDPKYFYSMSLTIKTINIKETLSFIKRKWHELDLGDIYSYAFLDENFNRYYRSEEKIGRIFTTFACLAIFLSCLGLFGLVYYTARQRLKEIGIRKVLGASVPAVAGLLSRDFIKCVLISNIIAWPVAYLFMRRWLQNFAYRTSLDIWIFILSGLAALVIAVLTVSYQTIKAAMANPVDSLRYE